MSKSTPRRRDTRAVIFPFDLFGSAGSSAGAQLLADALREMLDDNLQETVPNRSDTYNKSVKIKEVELETIEQLANWQEMGRKTCAKALAKDNRLLWVSGNHLGVLPVYEEIAANYPDTLIIQLDAHLDIYNLHDCTEELSHGNFLLHCQRPLPSIINVGHRELLLKPEYIRQYYLDAFPAEQWHVQEAEVLNALGQICDASKKIFLDIDCDVFDSAYFPAITHTQPFGLEPANFLRLLNAIWSDRVIGVAISEFHPAHDVEDRSLRFLMWFLESILLRWYEA